MAGINMAIISGRLGGVPEIKHMTSGTSVANFSIATSETWKDKSTGEAREKTQWHRVVVWSDGLVAAIEKTMRKGMLVEVVGQIETREWEKDGIKRYATEIVVKGFGHTINWYATEKREARQEPEHRGQPSGGPRGDIDDEIPF